MEFGGCEACLVYMKLNSKNFKGMTKMLFIFYYPFHFRCCSVSPSPSQCASPQTGCNEPFGSHAACALRIDGAPRRTSSGPLQRRLDKEKLILIFLKY